MKKIILSLAMFAFILSGCGKELFDGPHHKKRHHGCGKNDQKEEVEPVKADPNSTEQKLPGTK